MILVLDTSKHNGIIDVGQAKSQGVSAIAIRCTVGNYYCDRLDTDKMGENFAKTWDNCKQNEMPVSPYNVIMPAYRDGGSDRISADEHLDWFFTWFANRQPDFPIIWDCEMSRYQTYDWITAVIQGCVKGTKGFGGFDYPMIYTRKYWWDAHVKPWSEWCRCPLFVAWYPYKDGVVNSFYVDFPPPNIRPWLPRDWAEAKEKFGAWQYSADGNRQGARFGARSKAIDLSMAEEDVFLNKLNPIPPPEPKFLADINVMMDNISWAGSTELEKV